MLGLVVQRSTLPAPRSSIAPIICVEENNVLGILHLRLVHPGMYLNMYHKLQEQIHMQDYLGISSSLFLGRGAKYSSL